MHNRTRVITAAVLSHGRGDRFEAVRRWTAEQREIKYELDTPMTHVYTPSPSYNAVLAAADAGTRIYTDGSEPFQTIQESSLFRCRMVVVFFPFFSIKKRKSEGRTCRGTKKCTQLQHPFTEVFYSLPHTSACLPPNMLPAEKAIRSTDNNKEHNCHNSKGRGYGRKGGGRHSTRHTYHR